MWNALKRPGFYPCRPRPSSQAFFSPPLPSHPSAVPLPQAWLYSPASSPVYHAAIGSQGRPWISAAPPGEQRQCDELWDAGQRFIHNVDERWGTQPPHRLSAASWIPLCLCCGWRRCPLQTLTGRPFHPSNIQRLYRTSGTRPGRSTRTCWKKHRTQT